MRRDAFAPRPNWRDRVADLGLDGIDGGIGTYWTEDAAYVFNSAEIESIHETVGELERMIAAAVDHVVAKNLFADLAIPESLAALARDSWQRKDLSLYGRYDLHFDGAGPAKLLEYNADTPTALYEASVVQWHWLEERFPSGDQYNSIHEGLIAAMTAIKERLRPWRMHFTCVFEDDDDLRTTLYLRDVAKAAGLETGLLQMQDIGWDGARFLDLELGEIAALFKLYPWEWLANDGFFEHIAPSRLAIVEPAWRIIAASKGILAVLWNLFPNHPNLLPASFDQREVGAAVILKPLFGREGANIKTIGSDAGVGGTGGPYVGMPRVAQALVQMPCFDGHYPVIGAWVAGGAPHGIGVREDCSPITSRTAHFVPHRIE
jgi:glutathionylspermidine synthase